MKRSTVDRGYSAWAWLVVAVALFPRPGGGAVQSLVSERRAFERGVEYQYAYSSRSTIHGNIGIHLDTKVHLAVVQESADGDQEIRVQCEPTTVQWTTSGNGAAVTDEETFKDLSKWFSVSLSSAGHVTSVHYPAHERHTTQALKKTIASLLSFEQDDDVTRGVVNDVIQLNWTHTQQHDQYKKVISKSLSHNIKRGLISAHLHEVATPTSITPSPWSMFSNNMTATSDLRLIETHPLGSGDNHMTSEDLVTDTLEITENHTHYPLSDLQPEITRLLSCNHGNTSSCQQSLSQLIGLLSYDDLDSLLTQHIEMGTPLLSLVDAIALSPSPYSTPILTKHLLHSPSLSTQLLQRVLYHFTTTLQPDMESVAAIKSLIVSGSSSKELMHSALLALGGMGRVKGRGNHTLSQDIVEYLLTALDHYTEATPTSSYFSHTHSTLLHSLGNTGSLTITPSLLPHARGTAPHSSLSTQHAAIRAMRHLTDQQSVAVLEEVAEGSHHDPSLQLAAAIAYQSHPRATRDLSHVIKRSVTELHERTRRQAPPNSTAPHHHYNTTMPAVGWNTHFGDHNISVDMSRTVYNSFGISTDPFSSSYQFSIHDTASFTANMLLSNREEHPRFLRTELCLSGRVSYNTNILTDYSQLQLVHKFNRLQEATPTLTLSLTDAYDLMLSTQSDYSSIHDNFQTAFTSVGTRFDTVLSLLEQFATTVGSLSGIGSNLSERGVNISKVINSTRLTALSNYGNAVPMIASALNSLLPAKLNSFISSLQPGNQPFTSSSFYLPYLQYAPQKAMNNIYSVYRSTGLSLDDLKASTQSVLSLTSSHGNQSSWTNPCEVVWTLDSDISDLLRDLELEIAFATDQLNPSLPALQSLQTDITNLLRPSLTALKDVAIPIATSSAQLKNALEKTSQSYNTFTMAYESARTAVDTIFGQQFHPSFPSKLRPCHTIYGCGNFPSTTGGLYRDGIDLLMDSGQQMVVAPFSGIVNQFNSSDNPGLSSYNYSSTNTITLLPSEYSLDSITFVISNVAPSVMTTPTFVLAGNAIGSFSNFQLSGQKFIHVEAYKMVGGVAYSGDPSQFLSLELIPSATVDWDCNDMVTYVRDVVVDTRPVSSTTPTSQPVGNPLVNIVVPDHEFPQPLELVLEGTESVQSADSVTFFESSTFLMVGPIPVTLAFSSSGQYQVNTSVRAELLSKSLTVTAVPRVQASVQGSVRVGGATYATVTLTGNLVETTLPLTLGQHYGQWPLVANSSMDLQLTPSNLNLTSRLVRITSAGATPTEQVLDSQTLWHYLVPSVDRNEYRYSGTTPDPAPPLLSPSPYSNNSTCFVRQLSGRSYTNPAFELEIFISEPQGVPSVSYSVGTQGSDIISSVNMAGARLVVPHHLVPAQTVYVTVQASNAVTEPSIGQCAMVVYDRSPPLARVEPIRSLTSRPDEFQVLLSLFDEFGLEDIQYVAMGTVAGENGNDILDWQPINATSLINTPPSGTGEELYAFPRNGRLLGSLLSLSTMSSLDDCLDDCDADSLCKSFDYSETQQRCILHSTIEGPRSPPNSTFTNNFAGLSLQPSRDFLHYEKLGVGNSTLHTFTGLSLQHRQRFFVNLRLRNKLGYMSYVASDPVVVDLTPPLPGRIRNAVRDEVVSETVCPFIGLQRCLGGVTSVPNHRIITDGPMSATVFNGPTPLYDALYTSASNFITANWAGLTDPESTIYRYSWCISSTTSYSCDILSREDPHSTNQLNPLFWSNTGLARFTNLSDGSYYITVDAINSVEYGGSLVTTVQHSTPYIVDTLPPVVTGWDLIGYNQTTNQIAVSFNVSDAGSGVDRVELSVGHTPLDNDVIDWVTIVTSGDSTEATVNVDISDGETAYVKLRVTDKVSHKVVVVADTPIQVDRTPPTGGRVSDGTMVTSDADYQGNTNTFCVSWDRFTDPHTGISLYQWNAGTSPGSDDTISQRNMTELEVMDRSACMSGLSLLNGVTYYSTIVAYNGAETRLSVAVTSDGVTIDTSPPTLGTVLDGTSNISFSSSLTTISATWSNFEDPHSGISNYAIRIYQQPSGSLTSQLLLSQVVNGTSFTSNQFSLSNGDRVRSEVEAFNGAGLSVTGVSEGFLVDVTAPQVNTISDGLVPGMDLEYQNQTDTLSITWDAFDDESGIARIEVAVFQVTEGVRTRIHPNPSFTSDMTEVLASTNITSYTITGLTLTPGMRYITTVTFTNGAGLHRTPYETNGVTIDVTRPLITMVMVLSDAYLLEGEEQVGVVASIEKVELRLSGRDDGSGIAEYLVAVVPADTDNILNPGGDYVSFGVEQGGVVTGLSLTSGSSTSGPFYRVKVIARDNVGLTSDPVYSDNFWVMMGDHAGVVSDGDSGDDVDYTDEVTSVSAHFSGFFSEECGGVREYLWAVGRSEQEKSSLLPFTDIGVVFSADGSGYAQTLLPNLRSYQGQRLYTTVRGITGCGGILEATSDGFIIDSTPPSVTVLRTGSQAVEVIQSGSAPRPAHRMYQNTDMYSSIWSAEDIESGLANDVTVKIGSYPGGDDIHNGSQSMANYIRRELNTSEGMSTYVTIEAENRAGLVVVAYSEPVALDTTLPPRGEISCSTHLPSSPPPLQSLPSQLTCSWLHTYDTESTIASQTISIATDSLDQSRLFSSALPGNMTNFTSPVMNFSSDQAYYVTLYYTNGAGLENIITSRPVYYDLTPPISSSEGVVVLPNYASGVYEGVSEAVTGVVRDSEAVCVLATDGLSLQYGTFTDSETGIERYEIGVGHTPGADDIITFHTITPTQSTSTQHLLTTLDRVTFDLTTRRPFYATVRAFNHAGLHSRVTSPPVYLISQSNALQSYVTDGSTSGKDIDYQNITTMISGHARFGINCPMRSVEWAIENVDGNLVQNFTSMESHPVGGATSNDYFVSSNQVQLFDNEAYRIIVRGVDYTGRLHLLKSNGTSVTTQLLVPGSVDDGPVLGLDLSFQESVSMLSAHWSGFGEENVFEQEIAYYEIAAGSDRQYASTRTDVFPFTSVGLRTSYNITGLSLRAMNRYYITVRAHAVSGATADATSNGIQVGYGHMIIPGTITAPRYQSDNTSITVHWNGFQSDLPLIYYDWALGSQNLSSSENLQSFCNDITSNYSSQFEAFGFERIGLDTLRTRTGLSLLHAMSYYVTLRAVDQAKRCVVYSSPIPTVIDQTPPTSHMTTIGLDESRISLSDTNYRAYINQGDDISLSWEEFSDPESPIVSYQVAFYELQTCLMSPNQFTTGLQLFGYTSVGMSTTFSFKGLNLEPGKSYAASVRGRNRAGLNTTILTQPVIPDTQELTAGLVKDGSNWDSDRVFQSDISTLSASFSHAVFQPSALSSNLSLTACPNNSYYSLTSVDTDWSILTTSLLDGLSSPAISYTEIGQTSLSTDPPGRAISSTYDTTTQKMNSAAYQTRVTRLSGDATISLTIRAALGDSEVQDAAITSVVFLDSPGPPSLLADFDIDGEGFTNPDIFKGFGLQVHHSYTSGSLYNQQKVVMWFKNSQSLSELHYVTQNVTFDLTVPHMYEMRFTNEQLGLTFVRKVDLYVDGTIQATLHGLPDFSSNTRMILHVFQRDDFVPECDIECGMSPPSVTAVFSDVALPASDRDGACIYGSPFYSWASPIVEFRAGVGTQPGLTDVKTLETILFPCHPCLPGTCSDYACDTPCPGSSDPYITTLSLSTSPSSSASGSGSGMPTGTTPTQPNLTLDTSLTPGTYFITIEAVSASGQRVRTSSNGVLVDTTPPRLSLPIEQFDVQFSTTQDTRYQGNDNTISARWLFIDEESGIVEYQWAIGTRPNEQDMQPFLSIATATQAINDTLELTDNTTYYVTVRATNGAGLVAMATSHGITYQDVELNRTQLMMSIVLEHSRVLQLVSGENGSMVTVLTSEDTQRAHIEWAGITDDVAETFWSIGSESQSTDVLPRTDVSFNNGRSATIADGVLLVDTTPLANLSDIIALADGVSSEVVRGLSFEPGRLLYHQLEFCSLAHTCVESDSLNSIVIRTTDTEFTSSSTTITLTQAAPSNETIVLNKQYNITITTQTALPDGERVFAGFLTEEDVTRNYRVSVPYISNPYTTMDQTSREIARRFTAVGGPSFFISFLGADSLSVALELNVTFDSTIDLATSQVELAYWDIDNNVWREVDDTCQSDSVVDMATRTIRVEVCSTVLPGQDLSSLNRPASLSRRRRQTNSTDTPTNTTTTPTNATTVNYLDRPVHFIVMQVGNLSLNTPPSLSFPSLETQEDSVPLTLSLKQYVTDSEGDEVLFSLTSVPALGRVNLTQDGSFTYTPCQNCYGVEQLDIVVEEVMFDPSHVPLMAMSRLNITILGSNDNPVLFFYDGLGRDDDTPQPWSVTVVNVTMETNKTTPTTIAKVGGYDVDGSANFLQPTVSATGSSGHVTWLRAFTVAQSLPILWPEGSDLFNFTGPLAFIGLNITYSAQGGLASDQITVSVRDSGGLFPVNPLTINVVIVPSWCVNGGVCAGSAGDPNCTNTTARRDDPAGYSCSCPPDYTGQYCEESLVIVTPSPPPDCPDGMPTVRCDRDPCADATCPSHRSAVCRPSYCGRCVAEWFIGSEKVTCSASNATVCHHPLQSIIDAGLSTCDDVQCSCPQQPFECPEDSILVETRVSACCVTYSCRCPIGSCPHLMECADGVTPVPAERGVARPGRCCPQYDYTSSRSRRSTSEDDGFPSDCPFYGEIVQRATVGCNDCHCSTSWLYCPSNACTISSCVYNGLFIATETKLCTNTGRYSCTCLPTDQPLEGMWGQCHTTTGNTTTTASCYSL